MTATINPGEQGLGILFPVKWKATGGFHAGGLQLYFDLTNNDVTCMWFKGVKNGSKEKIWGQCDTCRYDSDLD